MSLAPIDLLFNIVVMLFWFRIWNRRCRATDLNPYMSGVMIFTQPVLDLFRFRRDGLLPAWIPAAATWFMLILFRGLALPALNPEAVQDAWRLRIGFASVAPAACAGKNVFLFVIFSFLSFGVFLFQVWAFALLFLREYRPGQSTDRPSEFLHSAARPFSKAPAGARPWLLLGFGMFLAAMMNALCVGQAESGANSISSALIMGGQWAIAAIAGAVDLLLVLCSLLVILIVGSWLVILTTSRALMITCREWLDFLLGPFRRFPIRLGPLDLTPIVAFLVFEIIHWLVNGNILPRLYLLLRGMSFS